MTDPKNTGPKPAPFFKDLDLYSVPRALAPVDLRLDFNEGPPPPASLFDELAKRGPQVMNLYTRTDRLEEMIAKRFSVDPKQVVVTAGADDGIERCCRVYLSPDREMVLPHPTFDMFENFTILSGGRIVKVVWDKEAFPVEETLAAVTDKTGIITVISPNNPTGCAATANDLKRLSQGAPDKLIVVDMAYAQFADEDLTQTVLKLPNTVFLQTFSKAWGMAGLRLGFAIGPKEIIHYLRVGGLYFPASSASLALAERWFAEGEQAVKRYVDRAKKERTILEKLMAELGALPTRSQANFALAKFPDDLWIRDAMAGMGIGVRYLRAEDEFAGGIRISCPGNDEDFTRVTESLNTICRPDAIIFDMDGVLADDSKSYRQGIIDTAATYGVELSFKDISEADAGGNANDVWVVTQRLLAKHGIIEDLEDVTKRFEEIYQGTDNKPGLREKEILLMDKERLANIASRFPLGIVTGRPRKDAEYFLEKNGIADLFKTMVCHEDGPLKPDPAPVLLCLKKLGVKRAWMIGDTPDDITAARRARVLPVGTIPPGIDAALIEQAMYKAGAARVLTDVNQLEGLLP